MAATEYPVHEEVLDELATQGYAIYAKLKLLLEPEYDKSFVAIHVDSEEYEIAPTAAAAKRAIRRRHPIDGRVFIRKIGDEPEYGLAARFIAGQMKSQNSK